MSDSAVDQTTTLVESAVQCAAKGVHVFPAAWTYDAVAGRKDRVTMHEWWNRNKAPSPKNLGGVEIRKAFASRGGRWNAYGMNMGASRLVGFDLDGHEAQRVFFEMCAAHGCDPVADGALVKHTPRDGGMHVVFRANQRIPVGCGAGVVGENIDHRGVGGVLFGTGSWDERGTYTGPEMPSLHKLPEVYPWLADLANAGARATTPGKAAHAEDDDGEEVDPDDEDAFTCAKSATDQHVYGAKEADRLIAQYLDKIRTAKRGTINDSIIRNGPFLFKFVPGFRTKKEMGNAILEAQRQAWIASGGADDGDYKDAAGTIRRAWDMAQRSWKAVPPEDGDDTPDPLAAIVTDRDGDGDFDAADDERTSDKRKGVLFTDARFSELVADLFRESGLCYCEEMDWMEWTGLVWKRTKEDTAIDVTRRWCLKRWRMAEQRAQDADDNKDTNDMDEEEITRLAHLAEAWRSMLGRARLVAVVALARPQVKVEFETFDAQPDILNTPDGIVDLQTGERSEHNPLLYCTKITRAPWKGLDWTHPMWEKAIEAVPAEVRDWVQMFMGQGCTGRLNTEGRLLLLDGDGSNGKGVLCNEGAVWTLGDYAVVLSESILMDSGNQHPTEKMALRGARLTLVDETPEARRLDTQRMKKLLDQPTMSGARFLYKEGKNFDLTHTMLVMTNYLPAVTEFDRGTWRRLCRFKMPYTFKGRGEALTGANDRYGDPGIKTALKEDEDVQAACLAWLVRGAMAWYAAGRQQPIGEEPETIRQAVRDWRSSGDLILSYAEEYLTFDKDGHVVTNELHAHFSAWCEGQGNRPWSLKTLLSRLGGHELTKDKVQPVKQARASAFGQQASRPPEGTLNGVAQQYSALTGVRYRKRDEDRTTVTEDYFDLPD